MMTLNLAISDVESLHALLRLPGNSLEVKLFGLSHYKKDPKQCPSNDLELSYPCRHPNSINEDLRTATFMAKSHFTGSRRPR